MTNGEGRPIGQPDLFEYRLKQLEEKSKKMEENILRLERDIFARLNRMQSALDRIEGGSSIWMQVLGWVIPAILAILTGVILWKVGASK